MASEYLKKKYQDVKPDTPRELTRAEKRKNWWYYHKWHVGIVLVLLAIVGSIVWNALSQVEPDLQIAYVGTAPLPSDTAAALEAGISALAEDLNGDGKVLVHLQQYVSSPDADPTNVMAAEVQLIADISEQESFLFLLEDPEAFQEKYHTLCRLDGSLPDEGDNSVDGSVLAWNKCPVLAGLDLGDYSYDLFGGTITGHSRDLISGLSIGRRGFWREEDPSFQAGYTALWETLTEGAVS